MAEVKVVLNDPKTGKSYQKVVDGKSLEGMKLGDTIKGELIDLPGYEFLITGGSDKSGFPMRKDIEGPGKKKILAVQGIGIKPKISKTKKGKLTFKGIKMRKTVAGNTISENTSQINMKIVKYGKEKLDKEGNEEGNKEEKQ